MLYLLVADEFSCVFFLLLATRTLFFTRKKTEHSKQKRFIAIVVCGEYTVCHGINIISSVLLLLFFFFSFFSVSFVPFNFEVDRVSRFCLHLYWAQHFDCLSCHLFFLICSRARIRSTVAKFTILCMRRTTIIIIMTVINVDIFRYFILWWWWHIHKQCV